MIANADLQLWLDMEVYMGKTTVIPYVKSVTEKQLNYKLDVIVIGASGSSRISQGGKVNISAARPAALSRLSLELKKEDDCSIDLVLHDGDQNLGKYHFPCPR